jgi:hypothetical protein
VIEIVVFKKSGGPLTKRISLNADGSLNSDPSACVMAAGAARRMKFDNLTAFAQLIGHMAPEEAITLGVLKPDLPDDVQITAKRNLNAGASTANLIARSTDFITYRPGEPALALIDIDTKGMPPHIRQRVDGTDGSGAALASVLPALQDAAKVVRSSTSTGLYRTDSGERLRGSDGRHVYVLATDGTDIPRFLRVLHDRCWLQGFGWMIVSRNGQLLERSLVDYKVGSPEHFAFEGAPVVIPPLAQDTAVRMPQVIDGSVLDTVGRCPDLTLVERARLRDLKGAERYRLAPDLDKARSLYTKEYAARNRCSLDAARRIVERQHAGVLLPDVLLEFDDSVLGSVNVAEVLAHPDKYVGESLADPLEGVEYGRCKAKLMRRADGSLWIHSFAHGRTVYELKYDAVTIEAALWSSNPADVVEKFVRLLLLADVAPDEEYRLCEIVCQHAGVKMRPLNARIRAAKEEQKRQQAEAAWQHRVAQRTDPRPQLFAPLANAEWQPVMNILNDVLGTSTEAEPPMRDIEGHLTVVRDRRIPGMHALTQRGSNAEEPKEDLLPSPEQLLLTRLDDMQVAELIEQYVEFDDVKTGLPVHLHMAFVQHFVRRHDNRLPLVTGVTALPLVLPDGRILTGRGLNREHNIVLLVPKELEAVLPCPKACTSAAVVEAIRFLTDEWLVDVATDYNGKCALIAIALSIIQCALLPERPAYLIGAGQRSSGKTTVIHMVSAAVLGRRAAAAAWSPSEEERRKALFSYLGGGVPLLVWDNIPRGAAISCPSIEKALTAETYTDRVLGVTETRTVPASTVQVFTGNNISARGDMASRTLQVRLAVDRPDPENREFVHPDPVGWTQAHRGRILAALYTLLLGNPRLRSDDQTPAETRFKTWWHLVGAAVEYAAHEHLDYVKALAVDHDTTCPPTSVRFRTMFLAGEADEEQTSSLAIVLRAIRERWRDGCLAREVAAFAGGATEEGIEFKVALEQASQKAIKVVTASTITWRLKALIEAPVEIAGQVFVLQYKPDNLGGHFVVQPIK